MKKVDITNDKQRLEELAPRLMGYFLAVGVIGLVISVFLGMGSNSRTRFFESYLVNYAYFLSLSLGGLFFVLVQHLARAGWSVVVRRLAEAIMANLLLMAILILPVLLGLNNLYSWTLPESIADSSILQGKVAYLNIPFLLIRLGIYFLIWVFLSQYLFRNSLRQDQSGDPQLTIRMERMSAPGMLLFALSLTFAAFDLFMSRDPYWFSTIYGVYYFGGCFLGFLALLILGLAFVQKCGCLQHSVTIEHYHDLGKLTFGFVVFWAYIAFSQFMLIWYANLPEETGWYLRRQQGGWENIGILLLVGHFIIPFFGLISRFPKRRRNLLVFWGLWLLIMHWFDLYWLILPDTHTDGLQFHWLDLTCFLGIGGLYLAGVVFWIRNQCLIPMKDPRLTESLAFENA